VLLALLATQTIELSRRVEEIRTDTPDAVHAARVAARRMRSALAAFRPLVDRGVTDPVRNELRWLAGTLSEARDLEVVLARLDRLLDEEPPGLVLGPVRARIDAAYAARAEVASATVLAALDSGRYLALSRSLERLVTDPPWSPHAHEKAHRVLLPCVRGEWDLLAHRVGAIPPVGPGADTPDDEVDRAVHEARKQAKRVRYVVEALVPRWGGDARALAKATREIASLLGERQDTVVTRRDLLALAEEATRAGESAFTYGRLHARESDRRAVLDRQFEDLWARASDPRLRRWLE
jgi:CHAD domain-containing protein